MQYALKTFQSAFTIAFITVILGAKEPKSLSNQSQLQKQVLPCRTAEEPAEKLQHWFSIGSALAIKTCRVFTGIIVANKAFWRPNSMVTQTGPAIEGAVCNAPTPGFHCEEFFVFEMQVECGLRG